MAILRIIWTVVSLFLTFSLVFKFALAAVLGNPLDVLPSAIGVLLCFYLLFMLEGLQVAGLQIKDFDKDAIEKVLLNNPDAGHKEVDPVYKVFSGNFDGFVTGRQIFVIMTVVTIAFLNKAARLPEGALGANILNGWIFAFSSSTLVPAWWCQLLSQFMADGRAIRFIAMPGARLVLSIAMLLDRIQLGEPAHFVVRKLEKFIGNRKPLPVGKKAYYEASLDFYGKGKQNHEIDFVLGNPTQVTETITYIFTNGNTSMIEHTVQLSSPLVGDIDIELDLPPNVFADIEASDREQSGSYDYHIQLSFNMPLPRPGSPTDTVTLKLGYQTQAYSDKAGVPYTTQFFSFLPTESARIQIHGGKRMLKQPTVVIAEEMGGKFAPISADGSAHNWSILNPESGNNRAVIELVHPTVATVYQVGFQSMEVEAGNGSKS